MAREGQPGGFAIHAVLDGHGDECEIGTGTAGMDATSESGRRVRINATPKPAETLLEWLRVMWITPSMDALFTGPAGDRRRFLDRLVLATEPGHGQRSIAYEKAMRNRNRLLTDGSNGPCLVRGDRGSDGRVGHGHRCSARLRPSGFWRR